MPHALTCPHTRLHRLVVAVAAAFGFLTLFAGGRVLLGLGVPDHVVVRPILIFNTIMGAVYVGGAALLVRAPALGRTVAAGVAVANLIALLGLLLFRATGGEVASDTVGAMVLRFVAWAGIWMAARWMFRQPAVGA